jgi:hypothetical protein
MGTHVAPTAATWRPSRILIGFIVIALVGGLALGAAFATRAIRFDSPIADAAATVGSNPAAGYPAHYGLAGPSRVGSNAGSWTGYPSHYGLAGPSRVGTTTLPISVGAGYPAHNGLAGPSQLGH